MYARHDRDTTIRIARANACGIVGCTAFTKRAPPVDTVRVPTMTVRALSLHARYKCAHSGACCTSSWPIPVEADRLERMRSAIANGRLRPAADASAFDFTQDAPGETPALLSVVDGRCVFFDGASYRCRVHTALGHEALPLACRQFPRVVVTDPRGVSVVLSHYCLTAAGLLGADSRVAIVEGAEAFPAGGEYVGAGCTPESASSAAARHAHGLGQLVGIRAAGC